jgi:hypothetical protein
MPVSLQRQLDAIEPSEVEPGHRIYPCSAQLNDGTVQKCVYFMTAATSMRLLGRNGPAAVPDRNWILEDEVASIGESPVRLPARFANKIYRAGESHYGCYTFALVFSRWLRRGYTVGGFVDFLEFPRGHGPSDVKEVLLAVGPIRATRACQVPDYRWCVCST